MVLDKEGNTIPVPSKKYKCSDKDDRSTSVRGLGCGPVSVAMIISHFLDRLVTPNEIFKYFETGKKIYCVDSPRHPGTKGIDMEDLKLVFEQYGLRAEVKAFPEIAGKDYTDPEVQKISKEDMANYLKQGKGIIANVTTYSTDHILVIRGIDKEGRVYVYDPLPKDDLYRHAEYGTQMYGLGTSEGMFRFGYIVIDNPIIVIDNPI